MKPLTKEWVTKAEGDFATVGRELRARKSPNFDSACFHSQQCVEKYLKARLQEAGIPFPFTHQLSALLGLVLLAEPLWGGLLNSCKFLEKFAVKARYPGLSPDRATAKEAFMHAREIRTFARQSLGLKV
jgi:HEPN domain-containing protein